MTQQRVSGLRIEGRHGFDRRSLLKRGLCVAGGFVTRPAEAFELSRMPVLDAHIHLFDPTRAGGIPWPEPSDTVLYKPALPERYEQLARRFGVVGAIAIEASPLAADNDWLLATARNNPFVVGVIGDLVPGSSDFRVQVDRLHQDPLFLGLRYGNLWQRDLVEDIHRPRFMDDLKQISEAGLVFESANPNPALIGTLAELAERMPGLTIVVDHLPHAEPPGKPTDLAEYRSCLRTLGAAPRVFVKLSEIPREINGKVATEVGFYKQNLDELWETFGEDKVLFGSDWPNSDHLLPYAETVGLLKRYAADRTIAAQEKLFFKNSLAAYRWRRRRPDQRAR